MNIIDYIKKMKYTFSEVPFNAVDSLVLSQMSYCRIEFAMPESHGLFDWLRAGYTVKDFFRNECFDQIFFDGISDDLNMDMMAYFAASRRFRDLKIRDIVGDSDEAKEEQFGAMIFQLTEDTDFVALRGTDGSMMGWKEDFNLSYMQEVPSQKAAVEYIEKNYGSGSGKKRKLYIGGHSKGGNLAVYSAIMCNPEIQPRILAAFSLDGPGFRDDVQEKLDEIKKQNNVHVYKMVPRSSVIGMLMQNNDQYAVVESDGVGIMQHLAYTWQVYLEEDGKADFLYADEIDGGGKYISRTIREWLQKVDDERRANFTNALFDLLEDNGIETVNDIRALSLKDMAKVVGSIRHLEEDEQKIIIDVLKELAGAAMPKMPKWIKKTETQEEAPEEIQERAPKEIQEETTEEGVESLPE